ncbi:1,2-phenylacetyl-CoA epoxidase subunit PaaD [Rhodovulum sp. DZ06]|uniref:1,2-phenylacetyl-CoA epoxidase subunit PaaD n=1 Tax=Rhodovulum sp. DZ06 TaxID=3425126 RepID=UPI003D3508E1
MRPDMDIVNGWIAEVPDPEIPAVSLVDLGIVRGADWDGDTLVVDVTPTYSGCPATAIIEMELETHLRGKGLSDVRINRRMSPPWTTDWITPKGREDLRAYGIAPPVGGAAMCAGSLTAQAPACPRCGGAGELISARGSTPCKAQFRCRDCLEPYDYFKAI